jgi:hypothetical protein
MHPGLQALGQIETEIFQALLFVQNKDDLQEEMQQAFRIFDENGDGLISRGQCYKTFCVRKLQLFKIIQSVCARQAFPALSNVCG